MGLKSGSRDAGLDDGEDEASDAEREETADGVASEDETRQSGDTAGPPETQEGNDEPTGPDSREGVAERTDASAGAEEGRSNDDSETGRSNAGSIPYKLRREKVNDGREQVPYFLREEVMDAENELQDALEAMLGEDVYKSDYREASMVVAQRKPELVAEVLREWGYDYDFD